LDSLRALKRRPTIAEFDERFTCFVGGYSKPHGSFPFDGAWEYYRHASSLHVIEDIRVPFLAISATDDPVVQRYPTKAGGNGLVAVGLTPSGGHLGWFESDIKFSSSSPLASLFGTRRWVHKPVLEWLRAVGEDLAYDPDRPTGAEIYEEDGFLKEVGCGHLGCKEIADATDDDTSSADYDGAALLQGL
jgi:predicted alpha/beta-fold hydrolase